MDFYVENEIPMSAQELWRTMHTPEFDAFVAREYGLYAYDRASQLRRLSRRNDRYALGAGKIVESADAGKSDKGSYRALHHRPLPL